MITFRRHTNALQVASKWTKMEEAVRKQNILVIMFLRHTNALKVASKRTKMEEAVRKQNILVSKFRRSHKAIREWFMIVTHHPQFDCSLVFQTAFEIWANRIRFEHLQASLIVFRGFFYFSWMSNHCCYLVVYELTRDYSYRFVIVTTRQQQLQPLSNHLCECLL